jgi:hypothetical protein
MKGTRESESMQLFVAGLPVMLDIARPRMRVVLQGRGKDSFLPGSIMATRSVHRFFSE